MDQAMQGLESFLASVERRAFFMARLATRSEADALDLVQEAMARFVARYARKPDGERKPLFYRVLTNAIVDWKRREAFRSRFRVLMRPFGRGRNREEADSYQDMPDPGGRSAEDAASDAAFRGDLRRALGELTERQRQVFLLRAWEGLSVKETSLAVGCSQGAVKSHYFRALALLRDKLEEYEP